MPEGGAPIEVLGRDECVRLLRSQEVGRFAVAEPGEAPLVVPVNFVVDGETVVFRTDRGTKLAWLRQCPVSFQVDAIDPVHHVGWSVLVQGVGYEAGPEELTGIDVSPWVAGAKEYWIRIVPGRITGRRIAVAPYAPEARAYL